jgi:hypothetical protein
MKRKLVFIEHFGHLSASVNVKRTKIQNYNKIFSGNQSRQVAVTTFREPSRSSSSGNWYVYRTQDVPYTCCRTGAVGRSHMTSSAWPCFPIGESLDRLSIPKLRFFTATWSGWLPENILLNLVAAKATDHIFKITSKKRKLSRKKTMGITEN